jgi:hypothetical protein
MIHIKSIIIHLILLTISYDPSIHPSISLSLIRRRLHAATFPIETRPSAALASGPGDELLEVAPSGSNKNHHPSCSIMFWRIYSI